MKNVNIKNTKSLKNTKKGDLKGKEANTVFLDDTTVSALREKKKDTLSVRLKKLRAKEVPKTKLKKKNLEKMKDRFERIFGAWYECTKEPSNEKSRITKDKIKTLMYELKIPLENLDINKLIKEKENMEAPNVKEILLDIFIQAIPGFLTRANSPKVLRETDIAKLRIDGFQKINIEVNIKSIFNINDMPDGFLNLNRFQTYGMLEEFLVKINKLNLVMKSFEHPIRHDQSEIDIIDRQINFLSMKKELFRKQMQEKELNRRNFMIEKANLQNGFQKTSS